jgi:hypothetical protein
MTYESSLMKNVHESLSCFTVFWNHHHLLILIMEFKGLAWKLALSFCLITTPLVHGILYVDCLCPFKLRCFYPISVLIKEQLHWLSSCSWIMMVALPCPDSLMLLRHLRWFWGCEIPWWHGHLSLYTEDRVTLWVY